MARIIDLSVTIDLTHIPDLGDIDVGDMEAAEKAAGVRVTTITGATTKACRT